MELPGSLFYCRNPPQYRSRQCSPNNTMFDELYGNLPVFRHAANKWNGRSEPGLSGDNRPLRIDMPTTPASSNRPAIIQHFNEERTWPCELVECLPSTGSQYTRQSLRRGGLSLNQDDRVRVQLAPFAERHDLRLGHVWQGLAFELSGKGVELALLERIPHALSGAIVQQERVLVRIAGRAKGGQLAVDLSPVNYGQLDERSPPHRHRLAPDHVVDEFVPAHDPDRVSPGVIAVRIADNSRLVRDTLRVEPRIARRHEQRLID